jgi:alpha-2-macroglobulin
LAARLECTRVNAGARCSPLDSIRLSFTASVPRALALKARLIDANGKAVAPETPGERSNQLDNVRFKGPLPARARFRLVLPAGLTDDAGRPLGNAARFPLPVETGDYPPLAKFAAPFGILEAGEGGVLPVTLRGVENPLPAAAQNLPARSLRLTDDAAIANWLRRLEQAEQRSFRNLPLSDGGSRSIETTGSTPLIPANAPARRFTVPRSRDGTMQVVGIPLTTKGFHVVELASPLLGAALLGPGQVRHVATGALVTNMAVHLQWGEGNSLVWVTQLADARPVAGAAVRISDGCSGRLLWQGKADRQGRALVTGLPRPSSYGGCAPGASTPLFVSARAGDDYSFTLSSWGEGIQGYDFNLPTGDWQQAGIAHAVLDRTLVRPGERINLKLFRRVARDSGLARAATLPNLKLTAHHWASDTVLPVVLDTGRDPVGHLDLPASVPTGDWELRLSGDGVETAVGRFQVEEYRLPTVRAGISGPKAIPVAARSLPLDLSLAYLSGGGASGAPVTLRTRVVPRSIAVPAFENWRFDAEQVAPGLVALDGDGGDAAGDGTAVRAAEQPLRLGANGTARVTASGWAAPTGPATLIAEMDYADANGEIATKVSRLPLESAALRIGMAGDGWLMKADDVRLKLVVLGLDNRPAAGRRLKVTLYAREILSTRKRLVGGFYTYDNAAETRALKATCSATTDRQGRALCLLDAGVSGEVIALAQTQDDAGRPARATMSLWLAGDDDWWFGGDNGDRMDLVPEAPEVAAGGTARLQVRMPFREATALVTVLRGGVMDSFVTTLSGKDPVIDVKMKGHYAPNVYISVLAVRGRVAGWRLWLADLARRWNLPWLSRDGAAPTALVDLAKPGYRLGLAKLKVGWDAQRLAVSVAPDRPMHAVKEAASARVTVRAPAGTKLPADAEIAFAAVDEALLQLADNQSWNLLDAMMGERPLGVVLATAQGQVVGKRHYGRKAVAAGGGGGASAAMLRRDFTPVIAWAGRVKLNPQGEAVVPFRLNDSLSGFRLVAIASAGGGLFGTGSSTLRTTQDLQLLPGIPALVREGDAYVATLLVRNTATAAMDVTISGAAGTLPLPQRRIRLAAGTAQTLAYTVTAPVPGRILWQVNAAAGTARDAVAIAQTVEPVVPMAVTAASLLRAGDPLTLAAPAGAQRGEVRIALSPALGGSLAGVRAYMAAYPYDCLEQRLSRAVATGNRAGWDAEMAGLATWLDGRGLLRFFPDENLPGDPELTAYVLRLSRLSGWPLPTAERARMVAGLTPFADGRTETDAATRLTALAALAGEAVRVSAMLSGFSVRPDQWSAASLLDWREVLLAGRRSPAAIDARLKAMIDARGSIARLASDGDWSLAGSRDATMARLLLVAAQAWPADAPRLARALMLAQQRGHWDTTPANAFGTLAMAGFAARFETTPVTGRTDVMLAAATARIDWGTAPAPIILPLPAKATPLRIVHKGSGQPWVLAQIAAAVPATHAIANGLTLKREVIPVTQATKGRWSRGDVLAVRLTITARAPTPWVALTDPIPPGATILGGALGGRSELLAGNGGGSGNSNGTGPDWQERRTGAWRGFWRELGPGGATIEYRVRLGSAGRFSLPPASAEAMYAPDVRALLPGAALVVASTP